MITKKNINEIINKFNLLILTPLSEHFQPRIYGLGSSREMIIGEGKDESKDVDILIVSTDSGNNISKLTDYLESIDLEFSVHFGNVVKIWFPFDDKLVQIDTMVTANNDNTINYLSSLRFYSNEKFDNSVVENLKGLHRTELIRSWLKSHGFILGDISLKRYVLKDEFNNLNLNALHEVLDSKIKRARSKTIKTTYQYLKSLSLIEWFQFLNTRIDKRSNVWYLNNRYNLFGITDVKLNKLIVELLFNRQSFEDEQWCFTLQKFIEKDFDFINKFSTFASTLESLKSITDMYQLTFILNDYIAELQVKNNDFYYESIYSQIKEVYPWISIPEPRLF